MVAAKQFFSKLCILIAYLLCIQTIANDSKQKGGVCECEDIPPPGDYTCKDQKRFDKCEREWMLQNNYCGHTCGRCVCSEEEEEVPSPEITINNNNNKSQQNADAEAMEAAGQLLSNTSLVYDNQQLQSIRALLISQDSNNLTLSNLQMPCTCTDVTPPSTWEFTCQQHKLAGNCNHKSLIEEGFCSLSCGRCSCPEASQINNTGTVIQNTTWQAQFQPVPVSSVLQQDINKTSTSQNLPSKNNAQQQFQIQAPITENLNNSNNGIIDTIIDQETEIEEQLSKNDGIIDLIANQGSFRNDAYFSMGGPSRFEPYSPVELLSSLLDKVQQQSLNGSDIIASLNQTFNDDSSNINFISDNAPDVEYVPLVEVDQKLNTSTSLSSNIISPVIVLPTPTKPSPMLTGVPTPPLRLPDTTLQFQSLSLPQLAFDLGVADVPLLNLGVVDEEDLKLSQVPRNQIVVGTNVNSAVVKPQQIPQDKNFSTSSSTGYVFKSGAKIRGEGTLRSPKCFMKALEEIDDLSLFNKVMHDLGTALAHLIIPSDETVTFIAPSNTAIMRLMYKYDIAFQQFLDAPPDLLMALISYHALKGEYLLEGMEQMGAIDTMLGQLIYVEKGVGEDEQIYLSGHEQEEARLMETDIEACGITLHTIDTLLMPAGLNQNFQALFFFQADFSSATESMQSGGQRMTDKVQCLNQTLQEVLEQQEDASAALFSLQQANLIQDFEQGPITMFVPTDKVFLSFINMQLGKGATSLERENNILLHHIVEGQRLTQDDLFSITTLETSYPGGKIQISSDATQIIIQSGQTQAKVIASNLGNSCDIIIHTIDQVLLPQQQIQQQFLQYGENDDEMTQIITSPPDIIEFDYQQTSPPQYQQQYQKQQQQQFIDPEDEQIDAEEEKIKLKVPIIEDFVDDDLLSPVLEDVFVEMMEFGMLANIPFGDALVPLDAPIEALDQVDMEECVSIGEALSSTSDLSVLNLWLMDTGFRDLLSQKNSQVTLLAPTNEAFGELMKDIGVTLDSLQSQPDLWKIFLESLALHIVDQPLRFQDLLNPLQAKTRSQNQKGLNEIIEFQPVFPSTVKIIAPGSESRIIGAAIQACRSYIYPIDSFLLTEPIDPSNQQTPSAFLPPPPPSPMQPVQKQTHPVKEPCQTVDQVIMNDPRMVSFQTLLSRAGLLDIVGDASNITIFIPQNEGMSIILRALYDDVIKLNGNALQVWSGYHIVPGLWTEKSLTQGTKLGTLAGGDDGALSLEVDINPGKGNGKIVNLVGLSNSASIVESDIEACGAVLHILDGPLLPVERDRVSSGN